MKIVVVRHAEKGREGNEASVPISDRGRESARACGLWLRDQGVRPVAVAYTRAVRTKDTAEGILQAFDGEPATVLERGSIPRDKESWDGLVARLTAELGGRSGDVLLCVHGGGQKVAERVGKLAELVPRNNRCGAYILNVEGGRTTCVGMFEGWPRRGLE
jgi:phosphohistidine phosphatase SixA